MRLRTQFAIVLVVLTVVLSATVYGGMELYKQRSVEATGAQVDETAVRTADQVRAAIDERRDFVGFVASRPQAARFAESDGYLDGFLDHSRFFTAQVVAANGTLVAYRGAVTETEQSAQLGTDVSDRAYVVTALEGRTYVGAPEYVPETEQYLVVVSAPIFDADGVAGVFAAGIYVDESTFFPMVGALESSTRSVEITAGDTVLHDAHRRFPDAITRTATVESVGWTVTVTEDRSTLEGHLRDIRVAQGLGLVLVLGSIVALGFWEYRTNLDQTSQLLDGFAAVERGRYDARLSLDSGEEWEQISDGFNDLAAGLADRERALREREQRLGVLNRVLRHNLRNEMTVVIGYAEHLRATAPDADAERAAGEVAAAGERLAALGTKARQVESALADADAPTDLDLVAVVEGVVADLRADHPDVRVETDLPTSAPVHAPPALAVAVENVCENACKHTTGDEQTVTVAVTAYDGGEGTNGTGRPGVRLTVTDDGPGLPAQERSVFEQGRETPLAHSSGLGLWLVYWVVEKAGGTLTVGDADPHGTVVTIDLPAPDADR